MAEIGRISLVVAFVITSYLTVISAIGITRREADLLASARNAVYAAAALVSLAWGVLLYAFATHDFSLQTVARYNSRDIDLVYSLSGAYASQEGSLLMWAWGVVMMLLIVTLQNRGRHKTLMPWVTSVMGFVSTFFLSLLVFFSDPFIRLPAPPPDGQGLNPLLQNVGMLFHPPALYLGYVAFTVPFAFALAALITGQLGNEWIQITRRWTLFAWVFLGIGNLLGAQWAYVELGWGGYWGWDPVENSSFMPWLTGTAFLHSIMIQRRRGMLKVWNLALIIATFLLTVFGTFLTRSDILSSVHTFGETNVGPMFVAMMLVTITVSVALIWDRLPLLQGENELDSLVSRESSFLLNNLLLVGGAFAVLWGTMFPLISEAIRGVKVTVNAPFFNQVVGPILLAIVVLMGICPIIGWRRASMDNLLRNFRAPVLAGLIATAIALFLNVRQLYALVAFASCGFVLGTIALEFWRGARAQARILNRNPLLALGPLVWGNKPRYGGYLVHLGIVVLAIGVVGSSGFKTEKDVTLAPGQEATIGGYRLVYQGLSDSREGRKEIVAANITMYSGDQLLGTMTPTKEFYQGWDQPNTEVAIRSTAAEDLYLILNSWTGQSASLRLVINPLVAWIWAGGYLLMLGGFIAIWPDAKERRREAAWLAAERPTAEVLQPVDA
ncbi:MAG: heme lyase CcmF/NrfE family subunit [Sphingomonadaceae bacterium]